MYLLLGDLQDSCCLRVRNELEARNCPALIVSNPLVHPWRFAWRFNNEESDSQLGWGEEPPVSNDQIAGVLVRSSGWIDPLDWEPADLTYMQAETLAALLAWLWSLPCPVVNRYPSVVWYRPQCPLLSWQPLLQRCGLLTPETVVTNVEHEARAFGRTAAAGGIGVTVYGPISGAVRYFIGSEEEWSGLASLQQVSPVCLAVPHGKTQLVCVVGERVIWDDEPSPDALLPQDQHPPCRRLFSNATITDTIAQLPRFRRSFTSGRSRRTARYPSRFSSSPSTMPNVVFVAGGATALGSFTPGHGECRSLEGLNVSTGSRSTRLPYARGSRRAGTSPSFPRSALKCMAHPSMTHELIANMLGGR